MKKGERLFIVDLESVSFFDKESLKNLAQNEIRYKQIPFLYLISSYVKNSSLDWANSRFTYIQKKQSYAWMIYEFKY